MQAYYKTGPTTGQPGAQPYYGAQMTPHAAYANLWTGQAPMMTPYGAPGSFYPYPHPGMPPHQSPYGYAPPQGSAASTTGAEYAREGEQKDAEGKDAEYWRQRQAAAGGAAIPQGMDYNAAAAAGLIDEREAKRQRRKQSNRESARRSRLRKQAECEDLGSRVTVLTQDNLKLRAEVEQLGKKVEEIVSQNKNMRSQISDLGGTVPPEPQIPATQLDPEMLNNAPEFPVKMPAQESGEEGDSGDDDDGEKS